MNLLILTHNFAPLLDPRAFRWTALAAYWASLGHRVDVVCSRPAGTPIEDISGGVSIHRVSGVGIDAARGLLYGAESAQTFRKGESEESAPSGEGREKSKTAAWANLLYAKAASLVWWPDYAWLWGPPAIRRANALFYERSYDAMISVSLPFTGHVVGRALKRSRPGVRWILDVGDPFCFAEEDPKNNQLLYRRRNMRYEQAVFREADFVSVTTRGTMKRYAALFPESAAKIRVIPPLLSLSVSGGVEEPFFPPDGMVRLVYIGTLYRALRNPTFLLRVFASLLRVHFGERLELHFFGGVGDCSDCFDPFRDRVGRQLFLHGKVSREIVKRAMAGASALVNLGNTTAYQLPSKVVEYAATGKPVLNLVSREDDSSLEFFSEYAPCLSLIDPGGDLAPGMMEQVVRFLEETSNRDDARLSRFLSDFTVERIAAGYECLLGG